MKLYRVVFRMTSRARLGRGVWLGVSLPSGGRASLRTRYWPDEHSTTHPGDLEIEFVTSADRADDAAARVHPDARFLASVFSYLGNGPVGDPFPAIIHEITEDEKAREYHCLAPDNLGLRSTTRIWTTALNDLVIAISALPSKSRGRIERAMHWHSVALDCDDLLDRLQAVLNGFEALNPLLAHHLGIDSHEIRACGSCGLETKVPVASGVHGWLKQECGSEIDASTRDFRNGLTHGYRSIDELYEIAKNIHQSVEKALLRGIAVCTGAEVIHDLVPWPPLAPTMPYALALHGTVTGPVELVYSKDGELPDFRPSIKIKSSSLIEAEDRAVVELEANFVARLPTGVGVQIGGATIRRDAGSRLESLPMVTVMPADHGSTKV